MSSWFYLTALLLPPMLVLVIGGLLMRIRGRKKAPVPTTASVPAKAGDPVDFRDRWYWAILQFLLVVGAGAFIFFYDWASTPPGELLQGIMGERWFTWLIKTAAVVAVLWYTTRFFFPRKAGIVGVSLEDVVVWLIVITITITIIWGVIQIVGYFTDPPERKAPTKQVTVDFRQGKIGSVKNVNLLSNQTIRVLMEPVRQGSRYENCFSWLVLGSGEMETASKGLGVVIIRFDEKTRRELADSILTVQISKGIVPMGSPGSECSAKKIN